MGLEARKAEYRWLQDMQVKKIAVLRCNAIGDFIFSLPALDALRAAYPEAEVVYLGQRWHAEFLKDRPGPIDRVVVVPPSRGVALPDDAEIEEDRQELEPFFAQMRAEEFDIAIQMHGGGRYSNPFIKELGARLTAGLRTAESAMLDRWVPYRFYQHEILRYLELVSILGASPVGLEPRIFVTEADLKESYRLVPEDDQPFVVLHPGAGDPRRRWPAGNFAELGRRLSEAGQKTIVTGTGSECHLVDVVLAGAGDAAQNLCGKISISGLAGLLSRASVVVSNDSGPLHLAGAVGSATVGIYWCGNMITAGPITQTRHRALVSWQIHCPVCGSNITRQNCNHSDSFVSEVSIDEVSKQVFELLGAHPSPVRADLQKPGWENL